MALHALKPSDNDAPEPEPCEVIQVCPVCDGQMETVYERGHQKVCVCKDCHSGLTVPNSAWEIVRMKRKPKGTA
jgi:hypothetical protein